MERRNEWPPLEGEFILIGKGSKPESKSGYETRAFQSCKFCSIVCAGDKKETFDNLKVLLNSGCVIHYPDGSLKVLPPDEAEAEFNRMPPEHRALYC
jgi:hypothetical protein